MESEWNFWDLSPFKGRCRVQLTVGDPIEVDVSRSVTDAQARPLYLEDAKGRLYNWMNILWIEKAE